MRRLLFAFLAFLSMLLLAVNSFAVTKTLAVPQVWQHKDTNMNCIPGVSAVPHVWNHATAAGCVHCGMYCAPAACAMYAQFTGRPAPFINQDDIYDNSKILGGEMLGNGQLETHGLGMYPGLGGKPPEIQGAFQYAVGIIPFQFGPGGTANPMLSCMDVIWCIKTGIPLLWVDMGNWPQDQDTIPEDLYYDSGHCKIIAGYNDQDTAACEDDTYLIYDPWPTSGSPYWLPQAQVIDNVDVYLSTTSTYSNDESSWGSIKNKNK